MCLVVGLSLFLTAYLAVMFNRRAKADMLTTLTPLAEVLDGEVDLEEARAHGRYSGHIAEGRAANATDGPGKVFFTSIIDSAGGQPWTYTARRSKDPSASLETKFEGVQGAEGEQIRDEVEDVIALLLTSPGWLRVEYDPNAGHVRLTRPMVTRRDIPERETFRRQVEVLIQIGSINRSIQQAEG